MELDARSDTSGRVAAPAVVTLPAEIDIGSAEDVGDQLQAALRAGATVVIADMSATTFADSSAVRVLLAAQDTAAASHAELRLVIPAPAVLRILQIMGVDGLFRIYPSPDAARTPGNLRELGQADHPAASIRTARSSPA